MGHATSAEHGCLVWSHHSPPFAVQFDDRGVAQLVEVYPGDDGRDQAVLDGVQLTRRLMSDVVSDLSGAGRVGRRYDIVVEFDEGFTLWSLLSLTAADLDPNGTDGAGDGDQLVVEGVAIAPAHYWAGR